jgi:hypothetical protein
MEPEMKSGEYYMTDIIVTKVARKGWRVRCPAFNLTEEGADGLALMHKMKSRIATELDSRYAGGERVFPSTFTLSASPKDDVYTVTIPHPASRAASGRRRRPPTQ